MCVLEPFHLTPVVRSVRFAAFANYTTVSKARFPVPGYPCGAIPDLVLSIPARSHPCSVIVLSIYIRNISIQYSRLSFISVYNYDILLHAFTLSNSLLPSRLCLASSRLLRIVARTLTPTRTRFVQLIITLIAHLSSRFVHHWAPSHTIALRYLGGPHGQRASAPPHLAVTIFWS